MKRIFFVFAFFITLFAHGQLYRQPTLFGVVENRFVALNLMAIPPDTFQVVVAYKLKPHIAALHDTIYLWSPSLNKWIVSSSGGGGGGSTNLYNADGTFNNNRFIEMAGHGAIWNNAGEFTIQTTTSVSRTILKVAGQLTSWETKNNATGYARIYTFGLGKPMIGFLALANDGTTGSGFSVTQDSVQFAMKDGTFNYGYGTTKLRFGTDTFRFKPTAYDSITGMFVRFKYWPGGTGVGLDTSYLENIIKTDDGTAYDSVFYWRDAKTAAAIASKQVAGSSKISVIKTSYLDTAYKYTYDIVPANILLSTLGGSLGVTQINATGGTSASYLQKNGTWSDPGGTGITGLTTNRIPVATSATTIGTPMDMVYGSGLLTYNGSLLMTQTGGLNKELSFTGFGNRVITYFEGGTGGRYGVGVLGNELQTFAVASAHFSWNKGGDLNATTVNELMRLENVSGNLLLGTTVDDGHRLRVPGPVSIGGASGSLWYTDAFGTLTEIAAPIGIRKVLSFNGTPQWINGAIDTAINLGGGLGVYDSKTGDSLRFSTFAAPDFDITSNVISIDWTNTQKATASLPGPITASDWSMFNAKESALTFSSGLTRTTNTIKAKSYSLANILTDVGNVGGGEDNLMTSPLPTAQLATNGDRIEVEWSFELAANSNSKTIRFYFGSDVLLTLPFTPTVGGWVVVKGTISRLTATTQRIILSISGASITSLITGATQTLSGAVTVKATGDAVADNDIIEKSLTIQYHSN